MHMRFYRTAHIVALSLPLLTLATSHAVAAPTDEQNDMFVSETQFAPAQISRLEHKVIEGGSQLQLVATHEIAADYNPAPGLVQKTFQLRLRIQNKSKGGPSKVLTDPIVSMVPKPQPPTARYRHTATSNPFVDIHS